MVKLARLTRHAIAISVLVATSAAMPQSIVVQATGPSRDRFPRGQVLSADGTITLLDGDTLTVVDKGGSRVLRGPDRIRLADKHTSASQPERRGDQLAMRARAAAVRGDDDDATIQIRSLWSIDIRAGGIICVPAGTALWVTRGKTAFSSARIVDDHDNGVAIEFEEQDEIPWPQSLSSLQSGEIESGTGANAKRVNFAIRQMAVDVESFDELIKQLDDFGCNSQADSLRTLDGPAPSRL